DFISDLLRNSWRQLFLDLFKSGPLEFEHLGAGEKSSREPSQYVGDYGRSDILSLRVEKNTLLLHRCDSPIASRFGAWIDPGHLPINAEILVCVAEGVFEGRQAHVFQKREIREANMRCLMDDPSEGQSLRAVVLKGQSWQVD